MPEHLRVIVVVYWSALSPLVIIPILRRKNLIPSWVTPVFVASFLTCALGWGATRPTKSIATRVTPLARPSAA